MERSCGALTPVTVHLATERAAGVGMATGRRAGQKAQNPTRNPAGKRRRGGPMGPMGTGAMAPRERAAREADPWEQIL